MGAALGVSGEGARAGEAPDHDRGGYALDRGGCRQVSTLSDLASTLASESNIHPFTFDGRTFAHNGVVSDLDELDRRLGAARALVQGETDSERFLALLTAAISKHDGDVRAGIIATTTMLA